jgi:hypothetical protein
VITVTAVAAVAWLQVAASLVLAPLAATMAISQPQSVAAGTAATSAFAYKGVA